MTPSIIKITAMHWEWERPAVLSHNHASNGGILLPVAKVRMGAAMLAGCGAKGRTLATSRENKGLHAHAKQAPHPTDMDLLGISRYSLANMAVSDKSPLARLMSAT